MTESKTKVSRECVQLVVGDEAAVAAILAFMDASAAPVLKSATTAMARNLAAAMNIITNLAHVPACAAVMAARQVSKGGKDVFNVLMLLVELFKTASTGTLQHELLVGAMRTLVAFAATETVRRRMCARKKWVEKMVGLLKAVDTVGKRRGAATDQGKTDAVKGLMVVLGGGSAGAS